MILYLRCPSVAFVNILPPSRPPDTHFYLAFSLPSLPVNDMIDHPYETKSDSFYFAEGRLIMHNKASYKVRVG